MGVLKIRRAIVLVVASLAAVIVPASPAHANVSLSTSLTVPVASSVGTTSPGASMTMRNANSVPNQAETQTVNSIFFAPSCGAQRSGVTVCPTPDTGVFSIPSPATGATGTACAGVSFTVAAPNASGVVTFTPSSTVVLQPPGGAPGSDRCTVSFTLATLKMPATDVDPPMPGVQTWSNMFVVVTSSGGLQVSGGPSPKVTVNRGTPGLSTVASGTVAQGGTISDTATVTAAGSGPTPTGTVTFNVYGPNDATCMGAVFASSANTLVAGVAQSTNFPVPQAGVYRFTATYSGDVNYNARSGLCNDAGESVVVVKRAAGDYDGDGDTDIAVYRRSNGTWFVRNGVTAVWGATGDIAVPGDYNGNGTTDIAVYRPSTGTWFVRNGGTAVWGIEGDIPVPGDYDGNGTTDIAVYRPSNGTWYVRDGVTAVWGQSGDVPVPGDYDGNGRTDIAVYRPSNGTWFVRNGQTLVWGAAGDVPVPGDYNGNGTTDITVYRPSTGVWFVNGQFSVHWGIDGDVPVPGDYDANGQSDITVYRPSNGTWFVRGGTTTVWGASGDLPLPLPHAVRQVFYPGL